MKPRSSSDRDLEFSEVYENQYWSVVRYFIRRGLNECDARDACSETFVIAWRKWDTEREHTNTWIYGIARRVLANALRSESRRQALQDQLEISQSRLFDHERNEYAHIHQALQELSEGDREILRLRFWEELTIKEIAVVMDRSYAAIAVAVHRAKKKLHTDALCGIRNAHRMNEAPANPKGAIS